MSYDLTVVGAGLVGSTIALALANQHITVRLIDAKPALIPSDQPDLRVVALNMQSIAWLKRIGLWEKLSPQRLGSFESLCIEDQSQTLCFEAATQGWSRLGVVAENNHVIAMAQQACLQHPHIQCVFSTPFVYDPQDTRLVIAAEGAHSPLRQLLNIPSFVHDYKQEAWVGYVSLEKPHQRQAWQVFLPTGPLAFLPLYDEHKASVVWTRPAHAAPYTAEEIMLASKHHYGNIILESTPIQFPLRIQMANQYFKHNVVLLGDAIHTVHPLAGQGVNLGFADAQVLSTLLSKHQPSQWTHPLVLSRYQRVRQVPNHVMAHGLSLLNVCFAQEHPWLMKARSLGLAWFSQSSTLKNAALSIATGLSDRTSL